MSKAIKISSQSHLDRLLSTNSYVIADFYADWCGPCKGKRNVELALLGKLIALFVAIAPLFEQMANSETKAGKLAFVKINVDTESGVARKYSVSA